MAKKIHKIPTTTQPITPFESGAPIKPPTYGSMAPKDTQATSGGNYTPSVPPPSATATPNVDREALRRRYQEAANRIKNLKRGTPEYDKNAQILQSIGSSQGFNWQNDIPKGYQIPALPSNETPDLTGVSNQPAPPPTTEQSGQFGDGQPSVGTPTPPSDAQPGPGTTDTGATNPAAPTEPSITRDMAKDLLMKMFSDNSAFEPANYEGSPLYQFQKNKGLADLEKLYAARGLTKSGAEIQGNSDFLAQVGAQEADRQRAYAENNAQRATDSALHLFDLAQNDDQFKTNNQFDMTKFLTEVQNNDKEFAYKSDQDYLNWLTDQSKTNSDDLYKFAALGLGQGNSLMSNAMGAGTNLSDLIAEYGKLHGGFLSGQYGKPTTGVTGPASTGGSGGGAPAPTYTPPAPTGPNFSNIGPAGINSNFTSNTGFGNSLTSLFGDLFGNGSNKGIFG